MTLHKSQVFFYLLASFIIGVLCSSLLHISDGIILITTIVGVAVITLSFKNKVGLLVGFLILAFAAGGARFNFINETTDSLDSSLGQQVVLSVYINNEPEIDGNRMRFVFKSDGNKILVTTNSYPRRKFGDRLTIEGKLELPQNFTDFDYATYLKKDGIRTIMTYPVIREGNDLKPEFSEQISIGLYRNLFSLKNKFQEAVNLSMPEPNASFINGILLGTRQNIPDDLKDAFSRTGTTHILAISGYNIMIISEAVLLGLIWFFRRRVAFWISFIIIIFFVILTGASASVVRAAIMGLLLSFARGYGRLYDQKNSIILTGVVMIWINPFLLVFDIGFQLSFMAVLGLIYLYPWLDYKFNKISEAGRMKELVLMTVSAQAAVAPLLIYYFGNFSPVSLPANILILPFVPMAMFFGFLAGIGGMISGQLGQLIGYIAWAITTYQIEVVRYFSGLL